MNVVIVSGREATGKSAIGQEVSKLLNCQYISKDMIKEGLFDSESHNTWNFSWYENRAKLILFDKLNDFIAQGKSVVIESNFINSDKERLTKILSDKPLITEIYCTTKGLTSFKRFVKRNENGTRHKGHHDRRWYFTVLLQDLLNYIHVEWPHKPIGLSKRLLKVDSTDFSEIDYDKIVESIKQQ